MRTFRRPPRVAAAVAFIPNLLPLLVPLLPLVVLPMGGCRLGSSPRSAALQAAPAAAPASAPCENCPDEAPPPDLPSTLRLPAADGERLVVTGTVTRGGRPLPGMALYVYHTDAAGRYTAAPGATGLDRAHGRLRGWLRTGADGRYRIETIRPGAYPAYDDPQHVHLTVHLSDAPAFWIDDVVFADDPRVTPAWLARQQRRGGPGLTHPTRDAEGVWHAVRDIALAP